MSRSRITILVVLFLAAAFCISGGSAQDDGTLGDLGQRVRQQNLDSSWLESRTWAEYGYRPHVTDNATPFSSLPGPFTGHNFYSYGTTMPAPTPQPTSFNLDKNSVQLTKYGTWH